MYYFNILSWNLQGLGASRCNRVRCYLNQELSLPSIGRLDMLCCQEHHLNSRRIELNRNLLRGNWVYEWVPAFGPSGTQGGLCIALRMQWQSNVQAKGVLFGGRVQYMLILISGKLIGFLNVYAPNSVTGRIRLWNKLLQDLPVAQHWCMCGDWNMIESPSDRLGGSSTTISGLELREWEKLIFKYEVTDLWHIPTFSRMPDSLLYSRSNRRSVALNLSRIDRFYADSFFWDRGGYVGIISGTSFSDHAPIMLKFCMDSHTSTSRLYVPRFIVDDMNLQNTVLSVWRMAVGDSNCQKLQNALLAVSNFFIQQVKLKQSSYTRNLLNAKRGLASLQILQEKQPHSQYIHCELQNVMMLISFLQQKRAQFFLHASAARWCTKGDTMSKFFFQHVTPKRNKIQIVQLKRSDGTVTMDKDEMSNIVATYYESLLSANTPSVETLQMRQKVWAATVVKVTSRISLQLLRPFSSFEILQAIKGVGPDVSPGVDGMGRDFFITYWDLIAEDLLAAFQEMFNTGIMPQKWKEGLICLIPKGDVVTDEVKGWRPITLLNTIYKIYAKLLALRLQPFLPEIVHDSQTGFMQERSIFDNVFLFWELTGMAMKNKEDLAVLLLDFEKAYDRVDWDFMEGSFLRLGFPAQ